VFDHGYLLLAPGERVVARRLDNSELEPAAGADIDPSRVESATRELLSRFPPGDPALEVLTRLTNSPEFSSLDGATRLELLNYAGGRTTLSASARSAVKAALDGAGAGGGTVAERLKNV